MAASLEPPPRPKWRLSNPASLGDRLIFAALSCYRIAIREGRYTVQHEGGAAINHLELRMLERDIDLADVLRTVAVGRICIFSLRDRAWVGGGYLDAGLNLMVYVSAPAPVGRDFADAVPTICSAWRLDPIESRPALAVPLGELARAG